MMACPKLRYIGVTATGYNNIDVAAARELGITVTNVPDYSSDAVAQMTFTFLLQFATGFSRYTASTAAGDWTRSPHFCYFPYPLTELKGKTLGLLGMGSIGKKVAAIGTAFGMEVIYCARTPKALPYEAVSPDKLLSRSDFLSLHCPLTEETREWINKESLAQMKSGAYLINTARGGLVNEEAVAEALKEGRLAGYGADVLTVEPQRADCPFIGVENCYLTPHVAWAPKETRERLLTVVAENLRAFLAGKPQNAV
jgi:glycerate dehydrogenase